MVRSVLVVSHHKLSFSHFVDDLQYLCPRFNIWTEIWFLYHRYVAVVHSPSIIIMLCLTDVVQKLQIYHLYTLH